MGTYDEVPSAREVRRMTRENWSTPCCGADWDWVIDLEKRLSDTGYAHMDNKEKCGKCGERWVRGEPKGDDPDVDRDCPICGTRLLVHKFKPDHHFHWKCPECYYVPGEEDEPLIELNNGEKATGYPAITGELVERREWLE